MSAPNKNYDPKAAASLAADEVARVLDEALAAVAAAGTLDELKAARIAHDGDRAPLSLASAEIGGLPPEARADAGRRVGAARGRLPHSGSVRKTSRPNGIGRSWSLRPST
jgi:phenylalanyl-tRNA synthetase alpha chain